MARPMMLASASGELKTRSLPKARCRPCVTLKTPPLPETDASASGSAAVGDVFAEHDDARVARHLVFQRAIDRRDHRVGPPFRRRLASKTRRRRRIDVGREDVERDGIRRAASAPARPLGGVVHFAIDVVANRRELVVGGEPLGLQQLGELDDRIARRLLGALVRRLVELLVVGQRMRVRPDDLGVHERRPLARARVGDGVRHRAIAGQEVGAVDALDEQAGKRRDELRDVAAGGLHFDRHRDRVAVVFDEEDDRQLAEAGGVERFPELALARRAVAERDVGDFVAVEPRLATVDGRDAFVERARPRRSRSPAGTVCRSGSTARRCSAACVPSATASGARRRPDRLSSRRREQHLVRRHAEGEAEGAVAVVGIEPVVRRLQLHAGGDEDGFVSGAADLEEDQALVLELDFLVVDPPRQDHRPIGAEEILAAEPVGVEWAGRARSVLVLLPFVTAEPFMPASVPFACSSPVARPQRQIIASGPRLAAAATALPSNTGDTPPVCSGPTRRMQSITGAIIPVLSAPIPTRKDPEMSTPTVRLHRWDEIALEKVTEMISRKIVTGEREMLAQIYLKKGALVPMHSHESEQMTYVLQGALKFLIGGEEITVREGEVLHIPSWVEHQAEALDDTFELDLFSPIRQDWLDHTDTYFHK